MSLTTALLLAVVLVAMLLEDFWVKRKPALWSWLAFLPIGRAQEVTLADAAEEIRPATYRAQREAELALPDRIESTEVAILATSGRSATLLARFRANNRYLAPGIVRIDVRPSSDPRALTLSARFGLAPVGQTVLFALLVAVRIIGYMPATIFNHMIIVVLALHVVWGFVRLRGLLPWAFERLGAELSGAQPDDGPDEPPRRRRKRPLRRR